MASGVIKQNSEVRSGYNKRVTLMINKTPSVISEMTEFVQSNTLEVNKSIVEEG